MSKLHEAAKYLIELDSMKEGTAGISNLKLQKLMYYVQGFHLAIFGKPIFDEHLEAWTHGPVFPDLYHAYKNNGSAPIAVEQPDAEQLTSDEKDLIKEVYDVYGQFSAWKLRDMTHQESPWIENEAEAGTITHEQLSSFFKMQLN